MPFFFVSCHSQVKYTNISGNFTATLLETQVFSSIIPIVPSISSTFEQEHVFPPHKSCFLSYAAIGIKHSAVPHHMHNVISHHRLSFQGPNRRKSDGVRSGLHHCQPNVVMVVVVCKHVWSGTVIKEQHSSCGTNLMKASIQIS